MRYKIVIIVDTPAPKEVIDKMVTQMEVQLEYLKEKGAYVCENKVYPYELVCSAGYELKEGE